MGAGSRGELTSSGFADADHGPGPRRSASFMRQSKNFVLDISLFGDVRVELDIRVESSASMAPALCQTLFSTPDRY